MGFSFCLKSVQYAFESREKFPTMTSQTKASSVDSLHHHKILILDFGSQFTQLIARRVREIGIYCEIWPWDVRPALITEFSPKGIILAGGPKSVLDENAPYAADEVFALEMPILGVCYGMQTMAMQFGGTVEGGHNGEYGYAEFRARNHSSLFSGIQDKTNAEGHGLLDVWMSHGDRVTEVPADFTVIGTSKEAPIAAMAHNTKPWFGIQFHPEVTHTVKGKEILERFVVDICNCETNWTTENIAQTQIQNVRQQVGDEHVILGLSGGVDSSVVAALLHEAIGQQLTCVFVDTGLLRLGEGDQVMATFAEHMGIKVIRINAEDRYLDALKGVNDPEKKRKIIGGLFIDIFEEESAKIKDAKWLAQGTIYPDVIESAGSETGKADVIKSHHNVGGLPEHMTLKLVEPLRELFKDEVRELGVSLGLPPEMVYRHPFPGPGLGVRILGEVKKEYADILRQADHIFIAALREHGWYDKTSQAFAVFLPVKSVGVMGDGRRYDYVIALRAVETVDFMTARWAHLPYEFLGEISRKIINEIKGVSRVTYDISDKPPATIEWE